jgi:hypothetical protein
VDVATTRSGHGAKLTEQADYLKEIQPQQIEVSGDGL